MPIPFPSTAKDDGRIWPKRAASRASGRRSHSPGRGGTPPVGRRRSTGARISYAVSWCAATLAIFAVFIGAAGVVMLVAGHRDEATIGLALLCAAGGAYLGWFLYMGPGQGSPTAAAPTRHPAPRRRTAPTVRSDDDEPAHPSNRRSVCWFCGGTERANNRLIWGDRAAICERCTRHARDMVRQGRSTV